MLSRSRAICVNTPRWPTDARQVHVASNPYVVIVFLEVYSVSHLAASGSPRH